MGAECENVKPDASSPDDKASQVRRMFDRIAPSYDFMNRAMTLGIDRLWRRKAVGLVARHGGTRILDVATGTGDLALQMARRIDGAEITGVDLSEGMIGIGREKVARAGMSDRISL
ncbi:bifunctional demethylmenaquinone methyltransferase/2-methoxy-6-polyprenyl-1,4-benzoquinol methylase, partial [Paramuribaculum intestinale]